MSQNNKEASASFLHSELELAQSHHELKRFSHHYVLQDVDYLTWLSARMNRKLRRECLRASQLEELNHDNKSGTGQDAPVRP